MHVQRKTLQTRKVKARQKQGKPLALGPRRFRRVVWAEPPVRLQSVPLARRVWARPHVVEAGRQRREVLVCNTRVCRL